MKNPINQSLNSQVHKILRKIETDGLVSAPRGLQVKELELQTLTLEPTLIIAEFEARPMNWRYFLGELAWYLKKDCSIEYINHFSNFWKGIADTEGKIHSNYGYMLFGEQLQWSLNALRKDPNTRQAISFVSRPEVQYEGNKDFVCTMYLNFSIRANKLNMKVQMRSNDIFYGLTYDAPFFSFVQQTMHQWLKADYPTLGLGTYYHCADNIHYYERHFKIAQDIMSEEINEPYSFQLNEPLFLLDNSEMILTVAGKSFIDEVDDLINNNKSINQQISYQILSQYFTIK